MAKLDKMAAIKQKMSQICSMCDEVMAEMGGGDEKEVSKEDYMKMSDEARAAHDQSKMDKESPAENAGEGGEE